MLSSTSPASGSAVIRSACILLGAAAFLLQGSSVGHHLLVEHSRCAAHGELTHGVEAHGHAEPSAEAEQRQAFEGRSDETHEHCAWSADRRDAFARVAATETVGESVEGVHGFFPARLVEPSSRLRFRVAPKNSPPA